MDSIVYIVNLNLQKLYDQYPQPMKGIEFITSFEDTYEGSARIIEVMEEVHLIETEDEPDAYYLTTYGYETIEKGGWLIDETDCKPKKENDIFLEDQIKTIAPKPSKFRLIMMGVFLLVFPLIFYYKQKQKEENESIYSPESWKLSKRELQIIDSINAVVDSLKNIHNTP